MKATAVTTEKAALTIKKFVTLGIDNEKYGIEVGKTREIIARYDIVPLPRTPDFIEGIISLRGDIIPVVDLRKRFELKPKERDQNTRVIVVELRDFTVGVQVDSVFEVMKLTAEDIEPPPPLVSGLKADYLEGVAEVDSHLLTILNVDKIFSTDEKLMMGDIKDTEDAPVAATTAKVETPENAKATSDALTATVGTDGMVEFRGKSYFVGKKFASTTITLVEENNKLKATLESGETKEFDL
jgi:purine-binding chemotaxis protein CheW